jgi:DNA-binding NarL/FixJ family response regulator
MTPVDDEPAGRIRHPRAGEPKDRLRILIADDDPYARRMVRDALQEAGQHVVGEAADGSEAVQLALHYRPVVVLMDVRCSSPAHIELREGLSRPAPRAPGRAVAASLPRCPR